MNDLVGNLAVGISLLSILVSVFTLIENNKSRKIRKIMLDDLKEDF